MKLMKKTVKKIAAFAMLFATLSMCACSSIPDRSETFAQTEETSDVETTDSRYEEIAPMEFDIRHSEVSIKLNAEGGVFEGSVYSDENADGMKYIIVENGQSFTHIADVPTPQHYRVTIAARSVSGASLKLTIGGLTVGNFYIPAGGDEFSMYAVDNVYIEDGPRLVTMYAQGGSVSLDFVRIETSLAVSPSVYNVSSAPAAKNASIPAMGVMKYFSDIYGEKTITAQNVTPGTNAEIEAITLETGRSPAMRCGEIALSLLDSKEQTERAEKELELGREWGKNGGLVSYAWHWYSPDDSRAVKQSLTKFDLAKALEGLDVNLLAQADEKELEMLLENNLATTDATALIKDIDLISEKLKTLLDENIAVIWQPLPDSGMEDYWWNCDGESYKKLWRLIFLRMTNLHGLGGLIWVWNGSSADYYPGSDYVDIIGQSITEVTPQPFSGRFSALSELSEAASGKIRALAVTSCIKLPKPDYMKRDNAMWLWCAIGSGDYIINTDGTLTEQYNDWQSLHDAYNSTLCVTLDELPELAEYALE